MALLSLGLGCWGGEKLGIRVFAAAVMSLYHLVESSVTCRHGEYPILYNTWAMCFPSEYASAFSWGIAIHFIMSTGIAKIIVGGRHWLAPGTMKSYLTVYSNAKMKLSRPLAPDLNRWACRRPWVTRLISLSTVFLECILVPSTAFLPPSHRWIGSSGMILMHIGIFVFMSKNVGIVFATTLPVYVIGFACTAELGTRHWWAAVLVGFLPSILSFVMFRGMLPEDWPLSPISLFMWSGDQAAVLTDNLMTGDTRVVLCARDKTPENILGLPVIYHGAVAPNVVTERSTDDAVHDCVLRVIGFTLIQSDLLSVAPKADGKWDMKAFLKNLEMFLQTKKRLFEVQSGQQLCKVYFVQIDSKGNVARLLEP